MKRNFLKMGDIVHYVVSTKNGRRLTREGVVGWGTRMDEFTVYTTLGASRAVTGDGRLLGSDIPVTHVGMISDEGFSRYLAAWEKGKELGPIARTKNRKVLDMIIQECRLLPSSKPRTAPITQKAFADLRKMERDPSMLRKRAWVRRKLHIKEA